MVEEAQSEDVSSTEIVLTEPTSLEGAILVHGFKGNISKDEVETVRQLLERGAIVSPSQRELSEEEQGRLDEKAPMDLNRVCFHCTYDMQNQDTSYHYRGEALLAMPVSVGEGFVVARDPFLGRTDVSFYSKEGVEIPLDKGVLLVTQRMKEKVQDLIPAAASRMGMTEEEFKENVLVEVDDDVIDDPSKSWAVTSRKIKPAENVTYKMPSLNTINVYANNLTELFDKLEPARAGQLGK